MADIENKPQNEAKQNKETQQKKVANTTKKQNKKRENKQNSLVPQEQKTNNQKENKQDKHNKYNAKKQALKHWYKQKVEQRRKDLAEVLVKTLTDILRKSLSIMIPCILGALIIFLTGSYFIFSKGFLGHNYPLYYLILIACLLLFIYGGFALLWGFFMGIASTILSATNSVSEAIQEIVKRIKNSIESRIDKVADTLEKKQASQVIKDTFDNLTQNIRKYATKTMWGLLIVSILTGVIFLTKNIVSRSFNKISSKAEFLALFSVRASLVLAIILNLNFFIKIALWLGVLVGIIMLGSQGILFLLLK